MNTKSTIKVIKREDRNRQEKGTPRVKSTGQAARETARDVVSNVSTWVSEFQKRRRTETSQALKSLFPEPPQTSGV